MKAVPEWKDRLQHWLAALKKDFYHPLGKISLEGFSTFSHLPLEQVRKEKFLQMSENASWGHQWEYLWLRGEIMLPEEADGQLIVLDLNPGGEATLYVNGEVFGTHRADWISDSHHYIEDNILTENGKPGERFEIYCEAYAGHDFPDGEVGCCATGPVFPDIPMEVDEKKLRRKLEASTYGIWNEDAYQLWMDVRTLQDIAESLPESSLRAVKILKALETFTFTVDFEQPQDKRIESYREARKLLAKVMECKNGSTVPVFYGIGHAHLDVAWLWPLAETRRKVARTFAAQIRLLEKYPEYRFLQSQPQLYAYCEELYPELFKKVKHAIQRGQWIAEGGMWVEPDTNMPSGESLIRQLIHGLRYYREKLGVESQLLWLPDTFGYSAALPQILKGCGIKYLVTQKIFWNYNGSDLFPYHYFRWQGNDGSEVTSYLPTSYTYTTNPKQLLDVWDTRMERSGLDKFLLPFGYGDGGGGPCRDNLEFSAREHDLEGCPKLVMEDPKKLFEDLEKEGGPENTYVGELYFPCHRGTYTSQAKIKWGNRKSELAIRELECWGSLAQEKGFSFPYAKWEDAWKKILLYQFHDILRGSSIARVNDEAAVLYDEVIQFSNQVAEEAAYHLAGEGEALVVFNSLSWERDMVLEKADGNYTRVKVPACGYTEICESSLPVDEHVTMVEKDGMIVLENKHVCAVFNHEGELVSFVRKESGREFAAGPMNRFMLFKDVPRTFDAWDIDSCYEQELIGYWSDAEIHMLENNPYRCTIQIQKKIGNSFIQQIVSLESGSIRLEFDTTVDWQELHRLLKVSFPVDVYAEEAINEIQFGYVKRPTHRSRQYDKDRFEVCNHRYTALSDEGHGAAVLNDCKYGVSVKGNSINLTLLRAEGSPVLAGDAGVHHFVYAFTAWEGSFLESPVVRQGYELNITPVLVSGKKSSYSFFQITGAENCILDTVKPAEDGSGDLILRLYESKHADTFATLHWDISVSAAYLCDMTESQESRQLLETQENQCRLHFRPFEVKTVRLKRKDSATA